MKINSTQLIYLASGGYADVYELAGTNYVMKKYKKKKKGKDGDILRNLQGISYFPQLIEDGKDYVIMEKATGQPLSKAIRKGLDVNECMLFQFKEAYTLALKCGIRPQDVTLDNVFINNHGEIKLIDVGNYEYVKRPIHDVKKDVERFTIFLHYQIKKWESFRPNT